MKKLLLFTALLIMGFSTTTFAQDKLRPGDVHAGMLVDSTKTTVTIEALSQQINLFIVAQSNATAELNNKINRVNSRLQDLQNQSSLRYIFREMIPIIVMLIIGFFIIFIVYIFTANNYRNNQLRYDSMLKCADRMGSVPDFFNKVERRRSAVVPVGGRVHLLLSVICLITGTIFLISSISMRSSFFDTGVCFMSAMGFIAVAIVLFMQYNKICENNRKE